MEANGTKTGGIIDIATFQTLSRRTELSTLTAGYGLVVVDECHHVPAARRSNKRSDKSRHGAGWASPPRRTGVINSTTSLPCSSARSATP